MTLDKFLAGFNIPHLGKTNSKRLAKKFKSYEKILKSTIKDFQEVEGIKTTAKKIHLGLVFKAELMEKTLKHVEIQSMEDSGPLGGKSFAMTGLRNIGDQDVAELISSNGGEVKSGVSKGLDYLIIKDPKSTSNKANKARKYGTKLISPDEFMAMVQ
jgi:DNA ligase (NAD+)